jgi:AraC family transcriptional regulator of adaptative response / DNA-3-methyladenine glycosylase II
VTTTETRPGPRCAVGDDLFAERYRAIDARDTRFDGQFFTAVSSTGIYCRPSCPARTPKPQNVTFYLTSAAAHEAGFRACKRCLPEATPGTPEWDLRRDLAGRAMRLIGDGVVDREGVDGLAARLGYTPRHVHRLLVAELGAGPLALARARRAQTARALVVGSDLPLADVAFAAGFGSVRQFNDTVQEVFDAPPRELRARSRRPAAAAAGPADGDAPAAARLDVDLPVRQPFDAPGVFRFLAARAVAGVEVADLSAPGRLRYARTLALPHGPATVDVVATAAPGRGWRVRVRLALASLADVPPAVARVRRLLDLDADPAAVDAALSADPALAPLVAATPGIRVPGAVDPHELVVRALVGQQISVAAARTHLGRLASRVGTGYASGIEGLDRLFPTPEQIARVPEPVAGEPLDPERPLRLPGQAVRAVLDTCRALADGSLAVHVGADAEQLRSDLVARPRIGPWTAAYVAMRVLGDPDAWLSGDVALVAGARAVGVLGGEPSAPAAHRVLADRAGAWAPWRSYAAMHLWQAASGAPSSPRHAVGEHGDLLAPQAGHAARPDRRDARPLGGDAPAAGQQEVAQLVPGVHGSSVGTTR